MFSVQLALNQINIIHDYGKISNFLEVFKSLKSHAFFFQFNSEGQVGFPFSTLMDTWMLSLRQKEILSEKNYSIFASQLLSSQNLLHCLKMKPHTYFVFLKSSILMKMDSLWGLRLLNLEADEGAGSKTMRGIPMGKL